MRQDKGARMTRWFVSKLPDWWVDLPAFTRVAMALALLAAVCLAVSAWELAVLLAVATVFVFVLGAMAHR